MTTTNATQAKPAPLLTDSAMHQALVIAAVLFGLAGLIGGIVLGNVLGQESGGLYQTERTFNFGVAAGVWAATAFNCLLLGALAWIVDMLRSTHKAVLLLHVNEQ
jgi:hypothetical protein